MKKLIYSALIITTTVLVSACNFFGNNTLSGKWEHTNSTASESFVLELTADTWTYYKNNEVLEKGQLEINDDQLVMGHEAEAANDHAPHAYTWSLSEDKTTLTLLHDNTKSVFVKKE